MTGPIALASIAGLLDTHLAHDAESAWYRHPAIPPKKLKNAIGKYACDVPASSVLALGDGTVFGSAKEGILITADTLFMGTSEGTAAAPLDRIVRAKKLGGWPTYGVEVECCDGSSHQISMTCFEKKQNSLVKFLNSIAANGEERAASDNVPTAFLAEPILAEPVVARVARANDTSIRSINAGLKLIGVCEHNEFAEVGALFAAALQAETEWPLLKGYCQYVGFNGREVDGIFLLTNRRLMLFSMEMGVKIVCVELTRRLLGKLPLPFFDSIACFFLFSIPRAIYVAARGGKEALIAQALGVAEDRLLADKPPLRKVEESDFANLAQTVSQADLGTGVWTGILARKFGLSFAPMQLSKAFSVPKDLILPEYETLAPIERLLAAVRPTLVRAGLDFWLDASGQKLTISRAAEQKKAAA